MHPARSIWRSPSCLLAAIACAVTPLLAAAGDVDVECIDGRTFHGVLIGSTDDGGIRVRSETGEQAVPVADLLRIVFSQAVERPAQGDSFRLSDGSRLTGKLLRGTDDALVLSCVLGDDISVPFRLLAAVRLASGSDSPQSRTLYEKALFERLPGKDVLITRGGEDAKALPGRLVRLDADGGTFDFGGRARTFRRDRVFGVVFAAGPGTPKTSPVHVTLDDGSTVGGQLAALGKEVVAIDTPLDISARLPVSRITRIDFATDRIVYVSDLTPVGERQEGIVHDGWPVRRDRSAAAGPLSIAGRVFDKGIGCHSYSELTYELDRSYAKFAATIGIDDRVRPRGSVVFRVLGDGNPLYDSGVISGRDAPQDVLVEVAGVARLTLVVDYGDRLDLSDHADWGGARLIKPGTPTDRREGG